MSLADPTPPAGFRIKGWHVLAGMIGFFALVIAVDVWFTVLAVRTFPGQVSVTPYEDGLLYNQKLARLDAQAKLGWRAEAGVEGGAAMVRMRDAAGQPLTGLTLRGTLERPATEAGRITLTFRETAPGVYSARPGAASGAWDMTVFAHDDAKRSFEAERRLTWP